ncbi:hypothetical protein [Halobacteriovorax sp. DA5]|uniref:hypothetical protein n=1 Tax=Halobacteriovorax sp. DA5 TaxID=2067553 RepID=UPI000CD02C24|nr:hypothetical protein [Halobacteriovorax sp. DA5]POB14437.1 hypothetical protein C0Z22_04920 [Halobacteriovorax sp. DA5]
MKLSLVILAAIFSCYSYGLNFQNTQQNTYEAATLIGGVGIKCDNGSNQAVKAFGCKTRHLYPVRFEDFIVGQNLEADKIVVSYTDEKGRNKSKTLRYDMTSQRTKTSVNLWAKNLRKKPVLHTGKNIIKMSAYFKGRLVEEKTHEIFVEDLGQISCGSQMFISRDMSDCFSAARACEKLYQLTNYCR